jgi:fatty-acyl-CoA synthase
MPSEKERRMSSIKHPSSHAMSFPQKIAYQMADAGEAITYAELDADSNRGARLLRASGLVHGDHIGMLLENSLDFFRVAWSAQRSGIYYTAISTHLKPDEIAYILTDCEAKVLFISATLIGLLAEIPNLPPALRIIVVGSRVEGYEFLDDVLAAQPPTPIPDEIVGSDMLYSSGTTGRPKGVTLALKYEPLGTLMPLMSILGEKMCGFDAQTVYLSPTPLYHAAPLRFAMLCGSVGGTTIVMRKFESEAFLRLVAEHRITHSQVVPTMFVRMLKLDPDVRARYDCSSLRTVVHAAAPCPADVKEAMIAWWGPILIEYYAGTEANGVTIIDSHEWFAHRGSVGRAVVGSIKILGEDRDGEPLPPRTVGDVFFADGPTFSYRNAPEQTASAHNSKGWSTLGDVGYLDEEGYLYLTDRKSYTIITGGVNVYPQETENVLLAHPAVLDAAVFGIPNREMGEEVKAVVQLAAGEKPSDELAQALIEFCKERISAIKCPRTVDFVADMPRTATGKLVKRQLRDPYWAKTA